MKFKIQDPDEATHDKYSIYISDEGETIVDALVAADVVDSVVEAYTEIVTDPASLREFADIIETVTEPVEASGF